MTWLLIALAAVFGLFASLFGDDDADARNGPFRCASCGLTAVRPRYGRDFRRPSHWVCTQCSATFKADRY
jgi:predicted SprT family Zn-dependent metalloprotease